MWFVFGSRCECGNKYFETGGTRPLGRKHWHWPKAAPRSPAVLTAGECHQSLAELSTYVAQPSISAQNLGLNECARLVRGMLEKRGFKAEVMDTEGAPVVFAERKGKSDKTLLIYNHYDVQPPEPLEL